MRVNIRGIWYDSEIEPLLIELNPKDKLNIENMPECCKNYVCFPEKMRFEKVKEELKIKEL